MLTDVEVRSGCLLPIHLLFGLEPKFLAASFRPSVVLPDLMGTGANSLFALCSLDRSALRLTTYLNAGEMIHLVLFALPLSLQLAIDDLGGTFGRILGLYLAHRTLLRSQNLPAIVRDGR